MADADEDEIPTASAIPNPGGEDAYDDLEDGSQDYRLLNTLSTSRTTQTTLPKRGTKDFEPNPTRQQSSALDASREAMHNALSAIRVHPGGKSHNVGIYVGERERTREERFRVHFDEEVEGSRCVVIFRWRSTHAKTIGRADRRGWTWLTPEEAIYLLERGSLDIRWGSMREEDGDGDVLSERQRQQETVHDEGDDVEDTEPEEPDPEHGELPMSLQGAYATFIDASGLTLERYLVYAGLKRAGYIVQRAPTWFDEQDGQTNGHTTSGENTDTGSTDSTSLASTSSSSSSPTLIQRLLSWLINPRRQPSCPSFGPLLAPGLYRNYNDVFRPLALIPYHQAPPSSSISTGPWASAQPQHRPKPPFTIAFHLWKPATTYRKSSPPPPSYYVSVVDARASYVPTASQIGDLIDSMPYSPLENEKEKRIEARIKHGKRSVVVAVVDMGVVSYLRFAESESGAGKLYEDKIARGAGGKRGGGVAGRGRGGRRGGKR